MIVTMTAHLNQRSEFIYHVSSGVRNPVTYATMEQCGFHYFLENPRVGKDGKTMKTKRLSIFRTMPSFHAYVTLRYRLPLEVGTLSSVYCINLFCTCSQIVVFELFLFDLFFRFNSKWHHEILVFDSWCLCLTSIYILTYLWLLLIRYCAWLIWHYVGCLTNVTRSYAGSLIL